MPSPVWNHFEKVTLPPEQPAAEEDLGQQLPDAGVPQDQERRRKKKKEIKRVEATCTHCGKQYILQEGSTTKLLYHLQVRHADKYKTYTEEDTTEKLNSKRGREVVEKADAARETAGCGPAKRVKRERFVRASDSDSESGEIPTSQK